MSADELHSSAMIVEGLQHLATPISDLKFLPDNPRRGDTDAVMRSYERFGQRKPIVALADGTVIAGNHQLEAARQLGWETIAVVRVDDDDTTANAFALADNRTADLGFYDDEALGAMLRDVMDADEDLLHDTGWDERSVDELLSGLDDGHGDEGEADDLPEDVAPEPPNDPVTVRGDVWLLGRHRLICGDCRDHVDIERLMDGNRANVVVTSPPYAEQREYDTSSGFRPINPDEYVDWWEDLQANIRSVIADDGSFFVNIKPSITSDGLDTLLYVHELVVAHVRRWGWHFATEFCWERNGVPKSVTRRFKNQFEPVYQFTIGDWKMRPEAVQHPSDNVPTAGGPGTGDTNWATSQGGNGSMFGGAKRRKDGTKQTMSDAHGSAAAPGEFIGPGMAYPGNRLPTFAGSHEATGHAAAFPVGLPEFFIKAYTDEGDHVLDPFMGSGSTLMAAHQTGRTGYGVELSPAYCDVILSRFQRRTGETPILESTGEPHDFTVAE